MTDPFSFLYSKEVMRHFRHPKNMGQIKRPDGVATVGNPVCGDIMKFYIKVEKKGENEYLKDIKFQTLGCGAAIASSSILTTKVKGKSLREVAKIKKDDLIKALGWLPDTKEHCATLANQALRKAINNYHSKSPNT